MSMITVKEAIAKEPVSAYKLMSELENYLGCADDDDSRVSYKKVMELDEAERYPEELVKYIISFGINKYYVPRQFGGDLDNYEQLILYWRCGERSPVSPQLCMNKALNRV